MAKVVFEIMTKHVVEVDGLTKEQIREFEIALKKEAPFLSMLDSTALEIFERTTGKKVETPDGNIWEVDYYWED